MRYRKLDQAGDYSFGHGPQDFYVNQPEAVGQSALTRLRLWQGEWFLDTSVGTPYLTQILGKVPQGIADQAIQSVVLGTAGVLGLSAYFSNYDSASRKLSVTMTLNTIYGSTEVNATL
jgi:hypothetical protein